MRRRLILFLVPLLLVVLTGVWLIVQREPLRRQWGLYRIGAAESFAEAQAEIAWFETGPDYEERLADLVGKWGTGNQRFDFYVARHLHDAVCSEVLREAFAGEIGRRPEALARWAHYWSWRTPQEPDTEIGQILRYLNARASAETPEPLTWREVLNLQAVFALIDCPSCADGLTAANWPDGYGRWFGERPTELPPVARPPKPFPDWQGPLVD